MLPILESEALLADDQLSSVAYGQFPTSGVWNASTISSIRSTWRNGYGPAEDESARPHGSAENGTATTSTKPALSIKFQASSQCSQPSQSWRWPGCSHGGRGEGWTWSCNGRCCCTGRSDSATAHLCRATPAEADHWRTSLPQDLQHVPTTSWQDHRYCCNLILV